MMSMPPISPTELEQLSAYLDGQLGFVDSAEVQRELSQRPDLQRTLEELRQTRAMLRNAPRRRVPHNFTLKPEMVPAKRRVFSRPVFSLGLASVLATFFLLLSVMLEFVPTPSFTASAPMAPQALDGSAGRNLAQATSAAEMSKSALQATPTAAQKAVEATRQVAPVTAPTPTPTNQVRITGDIQPEATPPPPTLGFQPPAPTAQPTMQPTLLPTAQPTEPEVMLGAQPTDDVVTPVGRGETRKTLTWLQTLLVVLAVATGLAALYLRRRH